jgi:hypothetical protein
MQQLHHGMALELRVVQQLDTYSNTNISSSSSGTNSSSSSSSSNDNNSSGTNSNTAALPQPTAPTITVTLDTKTGTRTGTVHRKAGYEMDLYELEVSCKKVLEISENFCVDFFVRDIGTDDWMEVSTCSTC